ncbi:hypothetical protein FRB95_007409 [Tulasnella sp. JGI-2019a]|nr:hypothetical protein FRB95_007409 [Tulasnella sp. JGI-2019a]
MRKLVHISDYAPPLPHEPTLEIITKLGQPGNSLSYRLPPGHATTLTNLCPISLAFKELTEPILYSTVIITDGNLDSFARAIGVAGVVLGSESSSVKAPLVKSMAFLGFQRRAYEAEDSIDQIIKILPRKEDVDETRSLRGYPRDTGIDRIRHYIP